MKRIKKWPVILTLTCVVTVCAAAGVRQGTTAYTNLKVLPKDISSKELQQIMVDDFQDGLGVTCGFCHAPAKDEHGLDFASDEKPEKEVSRSMMRMTMGINRKYFSLKKPQIGSSSLVVSCMTCHRGQAFPEKE